MFNPKISIGEIRINKKRERSIIGIDFMLYLPVRFSYTNERLA